jgi:DNA repair exonuclease SbcCD ATPase subunit
MATFESKARCKTCNEEKRTVICEGCFQLFCFDHLIDHRQELNQQLDHIEMDRDLFEQALNEDTTDRQKHVLLQQIGQWEQDSIKKIQQRASECRQSVIEHINKNIHQIEAKLTKLTDQIRKIRQENDFNEIDLKEFNKQLNQLQQQQIHESSNFSIQQSSTLFVNEISVVVATRKS